MCATPPSPDAPWLAELPDWFLDREVIPLDDHVALVVCHDTMREVVEAGRQASEGGLPILLTGETGVGKSLLARFIHANRDPYAPFVSTTTAGLEPTALNAMLFGDGREDGGASSLSSAARGGTLVLEEIGDLHASTQARLLRAWDSSAGEGPAQWIGTTNRPVRPGQTGETLHAGLLQRMRHIHLPPLRTRKKDIPALVAYLLKLKAPQDASMDALRNLSRRLSRHPFPGNVRELESIISLEASGLDWRLGGNGAEVKALTQRKRRT